MFSELGYYSCDGKIFETKLQAMLYANPKNLSITWHFNDNEYNSYNWSVEPEQNLDTLYDLRARQIREQYDYVILSYSGGSDSNNILESFLRQNLFIDEIITNWALDASSKFIVCDKTVTDTWNNNAEFHLHTTHRLEYIRNKSPKTKISVLDTSRNIIDGLLNGCDANWVETKNDVFNVTGAFQYNPLFFSEVRKRFDGLGRVAYVIGVEKPKLMIRNNSLYMYFIDKGSSIAPVKDSVTEYSNITPVLFYWSPDTCDMLAKQAHTVYKYIKTNPLAKQIWGSTDYTIIRRVQEELLKHIVYSTWDSRWFQVKKTTNDWDSELDYWFTRGWSETKEYAIWNDGLKNLLPRISNFIKYENGIPRGTTPCFSKFYYIGSFENI
jgi:hypothetical protein